MSTESFLIADTLIHCYGERRALDCLSFSVAEGEIFGLLGPNGSGKTTLFRLLSTLIPMGKGEVTLRGISLRREVAEIRRHLGVVFQSPSLDRKLTVRENLTHQGHLYGLHGSSLRDRISEVSGRFGIADRLGDVIETLSGGLQRRVEVAKGLLHRPALLLLDEPTTGLDPGARLELWRYLEEVNRQEGVTILVTTHLMDEAERCHRLMILDKGVRVCLDTPSALRASMKGAVITARSAHAETLRDGITERFDMKAAVVCGVVRLELPESASVAGPQLVAQIVSAFPDAIESITLSQPTLEDVFIHLTGRRFEV